MQEYLVKFDNGFETRLLMSPEYQRKNYPYAIPIGEAETTVSETTTTNNENDGNNDGAGDDGGDGGKQDGGTQPKTPKTPKQ